MFGWRLASAVQRLINLPRESSSSGVECNVFLLLSLVLLILIWLSFFACWDTMEDGGSVGGISHIHLLPDLHENAFVHHVYSSWSSSGECRAWSLILGQLVKHCPRR